MRVRVLAAAAGVPGVGAWVCFQVGNDRKLVHMAGVGYSHALVRLIVALGRKAGAGDKLEVVARPDYYIWAAIEGVAGTPANPALRAAVDELKKLVEKGRVSIGPACNREEVEMLIDLEAVARAAAARRADGKPVLPDLSRRRSG